MSSEKPKAPVSSLEHASHLGKYHFNRWAPIIFLFLLSIVVLAPIVWTISTSLRKGTESFSLPPKWVPINPDLDSYHEAFATVPIARQLLNSAIITSSIVMGQLATASLAGYAFARLEFKGRDTLFWIILATMMIPIQAVIIPVFILIKQMGLVDTLWSLILPALPTAFGTFLLRQYFLTIPIELEESALIDGANQWQIFFRVYLPLVKPGLAVLSVLSFNFHWNEFFRPIVFLFSDDQFPITLGIFDLKGYMGTGSISVVLSGVVLSLIPVVLIYIVGQRYLIEGIMRGAIKG